MAGIGNSLTDELYSKLAEGNERVNNAHRGRKRNGEQFTGSGQTKDYRHRNQQRKAQLSLYHDGNDTTQATSRRERPQMRHHSLNSRQYNVNETNSMSTSYVAFDSKTSYVKRKTSHMNESCSSRSKEQTIHPSQDWINRAYHRNPNGLMRPRNKSLNRIPPWIGENKGCEPNNDANYTTVKSASSSQSLKGFSNCTSHSENTNKNLNRCTLGYKRLQGLCDQTPIAIVTTLMNKNSGFEVLLSSNLRPDLMILVVTVLSKACACEFSRNKSSLLSAACQTQFLDNLQDHLRRMPTDDSDERKRNIAMFISNLLIFYETVMNMLPNTASEKFKNHFIDFDLMMKGVETYQGIKLSEQKEQFFKLQKQLENLIEERENKKIKIPSKDELLKYTDPPDEFREKSVYPSLEDLLGDAPPFIRPNIVDGAYLDVEHYLDIQFRLLREDFVSPLRDGLRKLREESLDSKKRIRVDNVRIYRKVLFGNPKVVNDVVGIIVQFDPEKRMNIKWEYSKRFMFGSLLLFTKDHFKHVIFGTVLNRDIKDLKNGEIIVHLHQQGHDMKVFGSEFVMVESEVYFEPYKHVLKALKGFDEASFPMKEYIIFVQKESSPPKYLLCSPDYFYDVEHEQIQVMNENSWPDGNSLGLDGSQLTAFKAALTEEFVIIQGPPGTGKTYLGLKIAKVLLKNSELWNADKTPILVVCYTNHALDQFLEGLVPLTDKIVRVGGQSKSVILSKHNLKEKRRYFQFRNVNTHLKREYHASMSKIMRTIQTMQADLEEIEKHRGIISVETLKNKNIISSQQLQTFEEQGQDADHYLQDWLLEGSEFLSYEQVEVRGVGHTATGDIATVQEDEEEEKFDGMWLTVDTDHAEFDLGDIRHEIKYALDLHALNKHQTKLESGLQSLQSQYQTYGIQTQHKLNEIQEELILLEHMGQYCNSCLVKNLRSSKEHLQRLQSVRNLWQLPVEDRWCLYKDWVNTLKKHLGSTIHQLETQYRSYAERHEEMKQICDFEIMKNSLVVGMTTTNAARLQNLLQALKPKIVIVEEAAEVFESHIVVSLTHKCEHVILIGDHQQLRPSPAVYKLGRDFKFDISLFERMVKNGMQCYTLENQHRMRPEIAKLIVPTIYPNLKNDISVYDYPAVRGITRSLFFVTHGVQEEEVDDIMSHKNSHEADFVLALCRHLIWQGYQPQEITVLATYKGQMFYLRKRQKNMSSLSEVNITVVDNYQGEENKIILLSLVRSNADAKIGFLKIENRVCVALSRAQEGLYIIGNMDNLTQSSEIWPRIKETLMQQNSYGTHLTLQCQIHSDQQTLVNCAADFKNVPEGGCSLPCKAQLECGHYCESICHVNNREHKQYKCQRMCERIPKECPLDHPCPKICYEDCGKCEVLVKRNLPCGHVKNLKCFINYEEYPCNEKVEVDLPNCGHKISKPCHRDVSTYPCPIACGDRLPCGHSCILPCHVLNDPDHLEYKCKKPCARTNSGCTLNHMCTKSCFEECGLCCFEVDKKLPCSHVLKMKCSQDLSEGECKKNCNRKMDCGHKCPRKCYETCGGCQIKVNKVIPACGHEVKIKCCESPSPQLCRKPCERVLSCGHACFRRCGQECTQVCQERVRCPVVPLCGHSIEIPCHLKKNVDAKSHVLLTFCKAPCGKMLDCSHICKGTCGECMQGRIHVTCREKCERPIICGHICKDPCAENCPPCSSKCQYMCNHSRCNKKCGIPCVPCKEPCSWTCEHLRCSKLCSDICDREPCYEPCRKKLECGHDCIGFCGDKCPPLCRICNEDDLKTIFFGNEEDENARFVYLVDCKHTLESEGLENWLKQSDGEIGLKKCPRCNNRIMRTQRYMSYVKQSFKDVAIVKNKVYGEKKQLEQDRKQLLEKVTKSQGVPLYLRMYSKMYPEMLKLCQEQLKEVKNNRENYLSKRDVQSMKHQIEIFNDLLMSVNISICKSKVEVKTEVCQRLFRHFDVILEKLRQHHGKLNSQSTADFNRECKRFYLASQLAVLESSSSFTYSLNMENVTVLHKRACSMIESIDVFTDMKYNSLREILEELRKNVGGGLNITDSERKEIVQAMGLKQGHWFKCPNGHVYCITECGGAMVESKCPDCGAKIGGSHHRLLSTNRLASEMDGAQRHAYPGGLF